MAKYALYLESGPRRRKTMVHVLDLLGCIANGPTTEAALEATPEAIRTYLRFMQRHGEVIGSDETFETEVAEHITEGMWMGNGSPYLIFSPDYEPVTEEEIETYLRRFKWMSEDLAAWVVNMTEEQLDAPLKDGGRTARAVLLHILGPVGAYLSTALGTSPGFSRTRSAAERGQLNLADGLLIMESMAAERVRAATPEQRSAVNHRPKDIRTLRKALRRMLEHHWEHLAELSRRPGGPTL